MIASILAAARLCAAISASHADVPLERACPAALAVMANAQGRDPVLLAAIGVGETRLTLGLIGSRGEVGAWQVRLYGRGRRARELAALTSYTAGVREAVRRLDEVAAWCHRRGTPGDRCMITGYRGGPALVRRGLFGGAGKVMRRVEAIRRAMGSRPGPARPAIGAAS